MPAITIIDLENAAQDVATIGSIANSASPTVTDRLGQSRPTMTALAAEYPAASANAAAALISKNAAGVSETNALASKVAAESARDAAIIGAGVYTTEALGRAAVADGVAFKVQGAGDVAAYEYRRTNSGVSVLIATYPSTGLFPASPNLFDKLAVTLDNQINNGSGGLISNPGWNASDYIPVTAGAVYSVTERSYLAWYNAIKVFISGAGLADPSRTLTAPAGAAYLRTSINTTTSINTFIVVAGDALPDYYLPYGFTTNAAKVFNLPSAALLDGTVTPVKTSFLAPSKNLFDSTASSLNTQIGSNGTLYVNALYVTSPYIPVTVGKSYIGKVPGSVVASLRNYAFYDKNNVCVAGGSDTSSTVVTIPVGVAKIRFCTQTATYQQFAFTESINSGEFESAGYAPTFNVNARNVKFLAKTKNLFRKDTCFPGQAAGANGNVFASAGFAISDYFPVEAGTAYTCMGASQGMRFWCAFDAALNVVTGSGSDSPGSTFTVPASGVAFYRVTVTLSDVNTFQVEKSATQTVYEGYGYKPDLYIPPAEREVWSGKAWASFGDSITEQAEWQPYVYGALGLAHTNCGVSGSRVSDGNANSMHQDARVNTIPTTTDILTFMGGTNDWAQDAPLGTSTSTNINEFYGALNVLAAKIAARIPLARVFWMTTPYGEYITLTGTKATWANGYTNNIGLTTHDYAEAIRVVARRWGFGIIDVAAESGFHRSNMASLMKADGSYIHPNDLAGASRIAAVVRGRLRDLAPVLW